MEYTLRVAIVISHPIQHFCPQYVSFAQLPNISLKVFFGSAWGYKSYWDPNFGKEISWGNLNLEKFDHIFLNGDNSLPVTNSLDASNLEEELLNYNPDLIITYGYSQKLQRRACRWAKKNNIFIGYISDSELRQKRGWVKKLIKVPLFRWYFSKIDFFLTVGNENENYYRSYGVSPNKFIRMHFPIDVVQYELFFAQKDKLNTTIREQYGINKGNIVLSVVGKLVPWKNQNHIIKALIELEKKGIYVNLFILGSGEKMEEWKIESQKLEKSKVFFTGFVNIDALPAYYAATDIYIHPASAEPHSIAISEAIYMGCPVIISNTCGSFGKDDDVQQGKNGFVYEFGNIEELSSLIARLVEDENTRKQFGTCSHENAVIFQKRAHKDSMNILYQRVYNILNKASGN